MRFLKILIGIISLAAPWPMRRRMLVLFFGYKIHPTSWIGFSWIFPRRLVMMEHSVIGHLNVCKGLDLLELSENSIIGNANWITGYPTTRNDHFSHQPDRKCELILGEHVGVSSRHYFDCTQSIRIGKYSTIGGIRSVFLSHSINFEQCKQSSLPITVGDYCFVSTNCVVLGGSILPNRSVLGACSLLNKPFDLPCSLYGGVPAHFIKNYTPDYLYFSRQTGFVR